MLEKFCSDRHPLGCTEQEYKNLSGQNCTNVPPESDSMVSKQKGHVNRFPNRKAGCFVTTCL